MTDEIILHGRGLDQPLPIDEVRLSKEFAQVDDVVRRALDSNDLWPAIEAGRELLRTVQLKGVSLARLLSKLKRHWSQFGLEDTFADIIVAEWGLSKHTIYKYISVYRAVFENPTVPEEVVPRLAEKPINTLNYLVRENSGLLSRMLRTLRQYDSWCGDGLGSLQEAARRRSFCCTRTGRWLLLRGMSCGRWGC